MNSINNKIKTTCGFIADVNKSISHNSSIYLSSMKASIYFNSPRKMAFYDLTSNITPPTNLRSLLGLILKFISTLKLNLPWREFESSSLKLFNDDFKCKAWVAGIISRDDYNPKL